MDLERLTLTTPVGLVELHAAGEALVAVRFDGDPTAPTSSANAVLREAADQLRAYFAGDRERFDLPLRAAGTPFQQAVWTRLAAIGFGTTTTYGALAADVGGAARAVGAANGANPLAVVVGCHRVIGSDGSLTGFTGGLERKRWLLAHEGALLL